jgi:hypothetical protein
MMLKRQWLIAAGLLATASSTSALARNYGMAGCGLGSVVVSGRSAGSQITAATTNGTGIKTFGITSGTSNCTGDGNKTAARIRQEYFVIANLNDLEKDISRGGGAVVENLGKMMGCSNDGIVEASAVLQQNHSVIFAAPGGSAVLETIARVLENDSQTAAQCSKIRA